MLESFFIYGQLPFNMEKGVYQTSLVVLSYVVASFASYVALSLAQELLAAKNIQEKRWFHWSGAFAMGAGIWSMHFIGMLSYNMRMVVEYDPGLTLLSMLVAFAVAYGVMVIVARERLVFWQIAGGGMLLGFGICGMHYVGMAAMQMDGDLRYIPSIFLVSVVVAITASSAALWMAFTLARHSSQYHTLYQIAAALIMGAGICGMHYTGMAASVFIPYAQCRYDPNQNFDMLALSITGITSIILGLALAAGFYKRISAKLLLIRELRESENRLNFALETSGIGAWELNLADHTAYRSLLHDRIFGYAQMLPQWTYEMFLNHVVPEDRASVDSQFKQAMAAKSDWNFECRIRRADGNIHWILAKGYHHFDPTGVIPKMSGIVRDITERKETEERLKANQIYLDTVIEMMPSMIFVKEEKGLSFVRFNKAGEDLTGLSRDQMLGRNDYDFFPKEQADLFTAADRDVLAHSKLKIIEEELDTPAGKKILRTKKVAITLSNNKRFLLGISEDITKIKEVEAKIIESEKFQELIKETNPDLIFVKDKEFRIVEANSAFLNGYPENMRDQVIGTTTLEQYNQEEAEKFLEMDRKAFAEGHSEAMETISFPNGEVRILYTQKIRFNNIRGETFILGISRDVTERERLITELTESNTELERFAYICSHDLQEPLRMISNYTERLVKHLGGSLDEKGQHYVHYVIDGAANARMLINDILTYAKVGREPESPEAIDCEEALSLIMNYFKEPIREGGVQLTHDILPTVHAHRTQVVQLFQNLISNAMKFRHRDRPLVIHIGVERQDEYWQFSVRDNGIGIAESHRGKIFQIFQRLNKRTEYPGTGIGLAICKKIVETYRGRIWIESELGVGTTFFFTLPAVKEGVQP